MSDKDIPSSGSRWEPADDAATEHLTTPVAQGTAPADAVTPPRQRRLRHRSALAAAGVGLVLAGGLGGFAIGHAIDGTEGSDPATVDDSDGFPDGPDGGRGGRPDFDRDGTVPGQSVPDGGPGAADPGADDGGTA